MLDMIFKVFNGLFSFLKIPLIVFGVIAVLFIVLCTVWYFIFRFKHKMVMPASGQVKQKRPTMLKQILVDVPRRYMLDKFNREADYFYPRGIHMFCGEQGAGKTIAAVEMILRLQKQYPKAKVISNFGLTTQNDELNDWRDLLEYNNGHQGVIVGCDELQNWFMSGKNQTLPEGMLEIVTQNRKNNRILCCTAQVFTRVNKGIREQVTLVYNPHTFLGCFTVVVIRKPEFDSEGNVTKMKYRGMYAFTHTDEMRSAYDTYKVIHTLAKDGFREPIPLHETKVFVATAKAK